MADTSDDAGDVSELPPSAKLVYRELERDDPLPRQTLKERTRLSDRTLYRAVRTLVDDGYVLRTRQNDDLRRVAYHLGDNADA